MNVETKDVKLTTFSVTIQALHVNSKQMTLSVFRQLPVVSPAVYGNEDGKYVYCDERFSDPETIKCNDDRWDNWGIVKYNIKDEGSFWLVCSNRGILYRMMLFSPDNFICLKSESMVDEMIRYINKEKRKLESEEGILNDIIKELHHINTLEDVVDGRVDGKQRLLEYKEYHDIKVNNLKVEIYDAECKLKEIIDVRNKTKHAAEMNIEAAKILPQLFIAL